MPRFVRPKGVLGNIASRTKYNPRSRASHRQISGHEGIAAGDLQKMEEEFLEGERPSTEQVQEWKQRELGNEEAEAFVYGGKEIFMHSSNVRSAQYMPDSQQMYVSFKNGGQYIYDNVSVQEAIKMIQALSKGGEIWDTYRVRGSKTATRKPYKKISE